MTPNDGSDQRNPSAEGTDSAAATVRRRELLRGAAGFAVTLTSVGDLARSGPLRGGPPNPDEWAVVFEDEFTGRLLNRDKWSIGYGWGRTSSPSDEIVVDRNVDVRDGLLRLRQTNPSVGPPYYTGVVNTKNKFFTQYGYFEARIQMPFGEGFLPAFWAKPNTEAWPPEIDFVELYLRNSTLEEASTSHHSVHWSESPGDETTAEDHTYSYTLPPQSATFTEAFHVFGCEWNESRVVWYVDGIEVARTTLGINEISAGGPFYMMLSTHIGRNWLGDPTPAQQWQTHMDVDWVRVWKRLGTV